MNGIKTSAFLLAAAFAAFPARARAAEAGAESGYRLIKTMPLPGGGFWDYLTADSAARRLYVTRGTEVLAVDMDSLTVTGRITGLKGVHGVALAPELGKGFISDGKADSVVIFDPATLKKTGEVKAGQGPDAIAYDPASRRVFAFNGHSGDCTVIDAAKGTALKELPLPGRPETGAADGKGRVYVNLEDKSKIAVIDSLAMEVTAQWNLAPCEEPSGMGIDAAGGRLFVGCHNGMMAVVDTASGVVLSTVPIGEGVDANAFDPGAGLAFSSNGRSGTLTVARETAPGKFSVVQNAATQKGARTMAVDLRTHRVFLVAADYAPAPKPTPEHRWTRPRVLPGTIRVLVMER